MIVMNYYTVDIGNSNPHVGWFKDDQLAKIFPIEKLDSYYVKDSTLILSQVGSPLKLQGPLFLPNQFWVENSFLDMPIHYNRKLGEDRLYQAYFLFQSKSPMPVILIDAGTFITIDLITEEGFCGGAIFPGPQTFLNCYASGKLLPSQLTTEILGQISDSNLPFTTEQAIAFALDHYLNSLPHFCDRLCSQSYQVITTGGFGDLLSKKIFKDSQFFPDLIHQSLAHIYQKTRKQQ